MPLSLYTAAVGPAIELATLKAQVRLTPDQTDEDDYLVSVLGPMASDRAELSTRRALLTQTWDWILDGFPEDGYLEIPKPPLVSVSFVHYVDPAGVTQTLTVTTDYLVQAPVGPRCKRGRIALPFSGVWPVTLEQMGAVTIRFVAGYGASAAIPPLLVMGMLMDAATLFENRESVLTGARQQAIQMPSSSQDIYRTYRSVPTQRLD